MQTDIWNECEKAINDIDLLSWLSQYGNFHDVGGDLVGPCPFHNSFLASISLIVRPQNKDFHCAYGKCNARGSIIQLLATFEKSDPDSVCAKIIQQSKMKQTLVQAGLPHIDKIGLQIDLAEYSQTQLRLLRQCPLRYWSQYVKGMDLDDQTIESTIGTYIHSALKEFFKLPQASRKQSDLIALFTKYWGKGRGPQDEREFWLQKAQVALQNAFEMNIGFKPIRTETELARVTAFPFHKPHYKLSSRVDRIDWYDDTEYYLFDYKWDERPLSEEDAAVDFQTVLYYITWTGFMKGVPPKLISYQFLTPGIQVDVFPTVTTMEVGIERVIQYIEKAEGLKNQHIEPEATRNDYCYNCKLYGKCPATKS